MHSIALGALALILAGTHPVLPADSVPLYGNLGNHQYSITTSSPLAQRYFDQGLRLYYAFNHAEAIRSFEEAARLDPDCALCWWGKGLALGPNINLPMDPSLEAEARAAMDEAQARTAGVTPREAALVAAGVRRYGGAPGQPPGLSRAALDSAWVDGLRSAVREFPDDLEIATLLAEALMTLRPWSYWTREGSPEPGTLELLGHLERVIAANPNHPGACHFHIHAVEAVDPERALPCAERLADLMPGAGHLVHMPGHIYIRVGRYLDAIRANEHAVHADETYIRDQRPGLGIYVAGYYPHNYDFMAFAAAMAGRRSMSLEAAEKVAEVTPAELLGAPGLTLLQNYAWRHLQMKVRFGAWDAILEASEPPAELLHARGVHHYARGRARVGRGELAEARRELALLREMAAHPELAEASLDFNPSPLVLGIAGEVLAGVLAAAEGRTDAAVNHLREAVRMEDGMVYGEPPEWSVPVRHDLGEVLLAVGRPAAAEVVFREDLRRFPENGWALHGLARSLHLQGREGEAAEAEHRFGRAWVGSDMVLPAPGDWRR
jgi:tetratricopeptide (TPR) repeat protein